jgi:transposase
MRYPNRRYGNPTAMAHYALWYGSIPELAKALKRSERSVRDWLSGAAKVPWWVPEIMRLQKMEHDAMVYQMTGRQVSARLGVVSESTVIDAGARFRPEQPSPATQTIPAMEHNVG